MRVATLLLLAALTRLPCAGAAGPPADGPRPGDAHDLVFLHKARPYRLRLHLQIDGRAFQADWGETVDHLFRYLDRNGDGVLSKAEASRAPGAAQWRQLLAGAALIDPEPAPDFLALSGGQKVVTLAALRAYYRRSGAGPLAVEWGWRQAALDPLSEALFKHLDRNRDGKLSRAELLAAPAVLNKLDLDNDEMVTVSELMQRGYGLAGPVMSTGPAHGRAAGGLVFLMQEPGGPTGTLVAELLNRYDRDRNGQLSRAEIGLARPLFDKLDRNGDGELDAAELARWPDLPADLEAVVPLEPNSRRPLTVLPGPDGGARADLRVSRSRTGSLVLAVRDSHLELVRADGGRGSPVARAQIARDLFKRLSRDGKVVDEQRVYQPPFALVYLLRLADRDGDGKVTEEELTAFVELQKKVQSTTTFFQLTDRGRTLFGMLDADGDGRLSQRELRSAWARLEPWAGGRDGLTRATVPQLYRVTLNHGLVIGGPTGDAAGAPPGGGRAGVAPRRGPLWFRKMDRNGDGDVSPGEFLGTREQFRRIDADGDGLIDADEAERADAWFRKARKRQR